MPTVSAEFTFAWSIHDEWSESYVGVRRLIYNFLPDTTHALTSEDGALCQLSIVGANHLMEVALYKLLQQFVPTAPGIASLTSALLEDASYHQMISRWLPAVASIPLDLGVQPFKSTEELRRRRNKTIHKTSASATVLMARAALFSAVQGCRSAFAHTNTKFPYETFLTKHPLPIEPWFSDVPHPPLP